MIFISIIIPTYNRSKTLSITIESFVKQNYPVDSFEIIVSDNNSNDNTKAVVEEWINKSQVKIKYIFEKRQGVHYARNTAAKQAKGDILYFTDDDMMADENLLSEIIKPFEIDDKVGITTGRVLPKWEVNPPDWILKLCNNGLLSLNDNGEGLKITNYDTGSWSCHEAIKRNAFFESGGFNPENTAGIWIGDGETGLSIKIKDLGYKFGYNGKSLIYHIIPPERLTQKYLNKRLANQGNSDSYTRYRKWENKKLGLLKIILINLFNLFSSFVNFILLRIFGNINWRMKRAYISYYKSRILYDIKLIFSTKWQQLVLKRNWLEE